MAFSYLLTKNAEYWPTQLGFSNVMYHDSQKFLLSLYYYVLHYVMGLWSNGRGPKGCPSNCPSPILAAAPQLPIVGNDSTITVASSNTPYANNMPSPCCHTRPAGTLCHLGIFQLTSNCRLKHASLAVPTIAFCQPSLFLITGPFHLPSHFVRLVLPIAPHGPTWLQSSLTSVISLGLCHQPVQRPI